MRQDFSADLAAITMVNLDGSSFVHVLSHDLSDDTEIFAHPRGPRTFAEYVISTQKPLAVTELAYALDIPKCPMMVAEGYEGYLGVPLTHKGASIGAVELIMRTPRRWTDAEATRLHSYAKAIGARMDLGDTNDFCKARRVRT